MSTRNPWQRRGYPIEGDRLGENQASKGAAGAGRDAKVTVPMTALVSATGARRGPAHTPWSRRRGAQWGQ